MSPAVTGVVLDENHEGLAGLLVELRDVTSAIGRAIGVTTTASDGTFAFTAPVPGARARRFEVVVRTGRVRREVHRRRYDGNPNAVTIIEIVLRRRDVSGWAVSLPGTDDALPIRPGNAIRPLVDDEVAWSHVAESIKRAATSVSIMQLDFELPRDYAPEPADEHPELVLGFGADFDPDRPGVVNSPKADRPERLLLDAARSGRQVRVMLPSPRFGPAWMVSLVILLIPMLTAWLLLKPFAQLWREIWVHFVGQPRGNSDKVADYFTRSAASPVRNRPFASASFSVVHAKAVLIDADPGAGPAEAILLGSPFQQSYWDTTVHRVFEPRRGSGSGEPIPVHDVSIGLRGPVVADVHEQFRAHWNRDAAASDRLPALEAPPEVATLAPGEYRASVQLVRTLNVDTLPGCPAGELGILEAYLRAIENARDYIYLENQYFTEATIADALIAALNDPDRPELQVILVLNVVPDLPFYPAWQTNLLARIRRSTGANAARFGVFTTWSHEGPAPEHGHANPVIMPNYLHTKTAIVDGVWATIGSANLDGASLQRLQIFQRLQFGINRNDELNCVVYNGIEGCPPTDFVDDLRRALWGEHLGLDPADPRLTAATGPGRALTLWREQARAKLANLIGSPRTPNPSAGRVLAYPPSARSGYALTLNWSRPYRDFLENSRIGDRAVDLTTLDLIERTTPYDFHAGRWRDAPS